MRPCKTHWAERGAILRHREVMFCKPAKHKRARACTNTHARTPTHTHSHTHTRNTRHAHAHTFTHMHTDLFDALVVSHRQVGGSDPFRLMRLSTQHMKTAARSNHSSVWMPHCPIRSSTRGESRHCLGSVWRTAQYFCSFRAQMSWRVLALFRLFPTPASKSRSQDILAVFNCC